MVFSSGGVQEKQMHVMIEVEAKFDEFMEDELWDDQAKDEKRKRMEQINHWAHHPRYFYNLNILTR